MVPEVAGSTPVFHPKSTKSLDNQAVKNSLLGSASVPEHFCVSYDLVPLFENEDMYPFKKAHLNDCGGDITKRWYIVFYAFDVHLRQTH